MATRSATRAGTPVALVNVVTRGDVGHEAVHYAETRVTDLLERIAEPVLFCRVKLEKYGDPARKRPARAQVSVEINGQPVRAAVGAHSFLEAVDLLHNRLADTLEHRAEHLRRRHVQGGISTPGEWRHGSLPTHHPEYFYRPVEERQVVRQKTFELSEITPEEAAFDMDMLDYDFHLFRDALARCDAVLERTDVGDFVLHRVDGKGERVDEKTPFYRLSGQYVPAMAVGEAVECLNLGGERFVFFVNPSTGRGNMLYHRYDGHYGLIEPADISTLSTSTSRNEI